MQQQLPIKPLERHQLEAIAMQNPCHKDSETLLLAFYYRIKATWSNSAIKNLQAQIGGLKLTNKLNKCQFARVAAMSELQFLTERGHQNEFTQNNPPLLPSDEYKEASQLSELLQSEDILELTQKELEKTKERLKSLEDELVSRQQKLEKVESFSYLLLTNRLLPPGPELNGTEETPAMRILGSPKTLTELEANYRELIKREHPDVSVHDDETATKRFMYLRSLYRLVRKNWEKLKPTAIITEVELERRMKATVPYSPESFW
jgi:hypothetical protein